MIRPLDLHRTFRPLAVSLVALSLAACASAPGPGLRGTEAAALFARFDGAWVLVPEESQSPQQALQGQGGGRPRPRGGEPTGFLPPEGSGGGRRPPGDRGPGGGGGGDGRPPQGDPGSGPRRAPRGGGGRGPEEFGPPGAELAALAGPSAFILVVTDSTFVLTPTGPSDSTRVLEPISLRLDGRKVASAPGRPKAETRAEWKDRGVRVERKSERGPAETEEWRIDPEGRLVVLRAVELPKGPKVEFLRVYRRAPAAGSGA